MWTSFRDAWVLLSSILPSIPHDPPHQSPAILPDGDTSAFYRGPLAHGGVWSESLTSAKSLVSNMTLEEKVTPLLGLPSQADPVQVNLTSAVLGPCPSNSGGVPRLGIPGMCFDDGRKRFFRCFSR